MTQPDVANLGLETFVVTNFCELAKSKFFVSINFVNNENVKNNFATGSYFRGNTIFF